MHRKNRCTESRPNKKYFLLPANMKSVAAVRQLPKTDYLRPKVYRRLCILFSTVRYCLYEGDPQNKDHLVVKTLKAIISSKKLLPYLSEAYFTSLFNHLLHFGICHISIGALISPCYTRLPPIP